jgi:hypothetical protein
MRNASLKETEMIEGGYLDMGLLFIVFTSKSLKRAMIHA